MKKICIIAGIATFMIIALLCFMFFTEYHQSSSTLDAPSQHTNTTIENYDQLITSSYDFTKVRAIPTDGLTCYHVGVVFPWDTHTTKDLDFTKQTLMWEKIHRMELNRDLYGFLFLNNPTPTTKILDAGCGPGSSSILMSKLFDCFVDGYSLSPKEIEHAKTTAQKHHCSNKLQFQQADILKLPVPENTYDTIWISESSEYVSDLSTLWAAIKKVGKNKSRVVMFSWCATNALDQKEVNDAYNIYIRPVQEHISTAQNLGYQMVHEQNISDWVTSYWQTILHAQIYQFEYLLGEKLLSNGLEYWLLIFEINK